MFSGVCIGGKVTDGDTIFIKAFPKKSGIYNGTIGVNETACSVGILLNEWIPSDLSGASLPDNAGSNNGTASNVTKSAGGGNIGDALSGSSGYVALTSAIYVPGKTVVIGAKPNGANSGLFGHSNVRTAFCYQDTSNNFVPGNDGIGQTITYGSTEWALVGLWLGTPSGSLPIKAYLNGGLRINTTQSLGGSYSMNRIGYSYDWISGGHIYSLNALIDVCRVFNGELSSFDWANLVTEGSWGE